MEEEVEAEGSIDGIQESEKRKQGLTAETQREDTSSTSFCQEIKRKGKKEALCPYRHHSIGLPLSRRIVSFLPASPFPSLPPPRFVLCPSALGKALEGFPPPPPPTNFNSLFPFLVSFKRFKKKTVFILYF